MTRLALTLAPILKAAIMVAVVAAIGTTFGQSLILVAVSAFLSGAFLMAVTFVQIRENRRLHDRLAALEQRQTDIAGAVGIGKRRHDAATVTPHEPAKHPLD